MKANVPYNQEQRATTALDKQLKDVILDKSSNRRKSKKRKSAQKYNIKAWSRLEIANNGEITPSSLFYTEPANEDG